METKHTPGNWIFKEQGDADEFCIVTDESLWVAAFKLNGIQTLERQRANGKLMAAASDMYEALLEYKRMYEELQPTGGWQGVYDMGNIAIKKATE